MTATAFTTNPQINADQYPTIVAMAHSLASGNTLCNTIRDIEANAAVSIDDDVYTIGVDMIDNVNDVLKSVDAQLPSDDQTSDYQITPAMSTAIAIMHATTALVLHQAVEQATNNATLFQRLLILSIIGNILMVITAWVK